LGAPSPRWSRLALPSGCARPRVDVVTAACGGEARRGERRVRLQRARLRSSPLTPPQRCPLHARSLPAYPLADADADRRIRPHRCRRRRGCMHLLLQPAVAPHRSPPPRTRLELSLVWPPGRDSSGASICTRPSQHLRALQPPCASAAVALAADLLREAAATQSLPWRSAAKRKTPKRKASVSKAMRETDIFAHESIFKRRDEGTYHGTCSFCIEPKF